MVKILLVKEKASDSLFIKKELVKYQYDVEIVNNANFIYPAFYNYNPDIVLMDLSVNGIDGCAISKELNEFSVHDSSIVLLCDNELTEDVCAGSSTVDFLKGPVSTESLLSKITQVLQRRSFKSSGILNPVKMTG